MNLVNMLESVIVGEIETIQTKFLREKGWEKMNKASILRYWGGKYVRNTDLNILNLMKNH